MFDGLPLLRYRAIIADPPWHYELRSKKGEAKSPQAQYRTMPLAEICAMPVEHLASRDCLLFMWATFPMLPQALEVLRAWKFQYVTGGAWHKTTSTGKTAFGTGYVLRSACEPFLIGKIGAPLLRRTREARSIRNLIVAPTQGHSRKPDDAHKIIETLTPGPYCELFARRPYPGWTTWGDQLEAVT